MEKTRIWIIMLSTDDYEVCGIGYFSTEEKARAYMQVLINDEIYSKDLLDIEWDYIDPEL